MSTRVESQLDPVRRPRIAIVAVSAANGSKSWRGVLQYLAEALRHAGADVEVIEIGDGFWGTIFHAKEYIVRRIIGRRYQRHREPRVLRGYARMLDRALERERIDVAISLKTIPISASRSRVPLVLYNDSPFSSFLNFYAEFSGMSAGHVAHGNAMERGSARTAALSIYTSQWAADAAEREYGVPRERIAVVPIGANIDREPSREEAEALIAARLQAKTRQFLWLGVDWQRKRGALAVAIVDELRRRGYDVHLTVAGAGDRMPSTPSESVTYVPFLDGPAIQKQLEISHFLILPTLADCTPLVYSEANAYAVPVLSSNVGGIATSISAGENGLLFDVDAPVAAWADAIAPYLDGSADYAAFARRSHAAYRERLNWRVAATEIMRLLRPLMS